MLMKPLVAMVLMVLFLFLQTSLSRAQGEGEDSIRQLEERLAK